MDKTNENGITLINLIIVIVLLIIIAGVLITTVLDFDLIPQVINAEEEYNQMVQNKSEEMDADTVFNLLELDG